MFITRLDHMGGYLSHRFLEDFLPLPDGWRVLDEPFPPSPEGYRWYNGAWIESPDYTPSEPPAQERPYEPIRRSKADFARLFTGTQEVQINKWEKICKSVPPEEYDDPANALTLTVERVLKSFERPLEFIELNHPETAQALQLLAFVGVFGSDPVLAMGEVERIIQGTFPA